MQFMKHSQLSGTAISCILFPYFTQLLAEQLIQFLFAHGAFFIVHTSIFVKGFLEEVHCRQHCFFLFHGSWNKNALRDQHFLNEMCLFFSQAEYQYWLWKEMLLKTGQTEGKVCLALPSLGEDLCEAKEVQAVRVP